MTSGPEPAEDNNAEVPPARRDPAQILGSPGSLAGDWGTVNNFYGNAAATDQVFGMSRTELVRRYVGSQDALFATMRDNQELQRLKDRQEREIECLQQQLVKVRGLLPPLVGLIVSLGEDQLQKGERHRALKRELEHALEKDDHLRLEFDQLDRYLKNLDAQQERVALAFHEARVEERGLLNLLDAVRLRWLVLVGGQAGAEPSAWAMTTASFALPVRSADEEDLLAYAIRVLDEANKILVETHKLLEELATELYRTAVATPGERDRLKDLAKAKGDLVTVRKLLAESKRASEAEKLKYARELSRQERELSKQKRGAAEPVRAERDVFGGILPGLGLFLLGVVIREVLLLAPLSDTQRVVFIGMALVFGVLPIVSLLKWSKTTDSSAVQTTVAALCAFCVVAGNFSWVVALIPALIALSLVVAAKDLGLGFAATLVGSFVLGVTFQGLIWWSWGGFDWLARIL